MGASNDEPTPMEQEEEDDEVEIDDDALEVRVYQGWSAGDRLPRARGAVVLTRNFSQTHPEPLNRRTAAARRPRSPRARRGMQRKRRRTTTRLRRRPRRSA